MDFIHYYLLLFFFNHPAPTEIYTLSLHDALPISQRSRHHRLERRPPQGRRDHGHEAPQPPDLWRAIPSRVHRRSEEHTSELQSHSDLVCRLLLEKKKKKNT